jgi:hypothetical protein
VKREIGFGIRRAMLGHRAAFLFYLLPVPASMPRENRIQKMVAPQIIATTTDAGIDAIATLTMKLTNDPNGMSKSVTTTRTRSGG